jgi:hypothetical protein
LILSGSGNKTAGGALTVNGDFTINGSSSFVGGTSLTHTFLGNWVVNTNAAAPFSYTTASTINFNTPGTPAATSLSGTTLSSIDLNNVTLNNTSGFSSSHDFSASGSVTVANGVTFAPSADIVVSGSGTLTGNGTVRVTRTSPSAEMNSQFTITTKTLTNLTVEYNGTAAQSISALTYGGLKINNANGVSLGGNVTVNGILTLQSGNISTSSNKVILGSSGSVSRTSGHVVGNLQKTVATGPSSLTYEVGDASNYSPVAVTFGNVATGGNLIAKVTATEHPNIASSTINPVRSVNRYWTLTNNGMVFDNYSATFNFVENDIDAGADANTFDVQHYNGSWSTATTGTRTSTSTQATGLTSFSDYAVGKPIVQYTINASAGSNGSITPSGNISVTEGASQSFTIAASTGYHIADVLVDGNSQGAISSYNFTNISDNHSISATFAIDQFTITVNAGANGSITPGTTTVNYGSNQSFSIAANVGYHIVDVLVDGNSQGAVASYNFANVTAAHTISATFAIDQFTITVNAGANGSITPGTTTVNYGSNQSFSIAANVGYHIVDVLVDGNSQGAVASYNFVNVTAAHTISATFAIDQFTITVNAGANGSITPGTTTVNYGSNQSFSIAANVGYHIVDVLVDGNSQGAVASYNFANVTASHTISATFAIDQFTITVNAGANGSITPGTTTVNYGSNQSFSIAANVGYHIVDVLVDGNSQGVVASYNFVNVTAAHTISATFAIDQFTITVNAGANGSITPGTTTVNYGSNQSFSIAANDGYHIVDVLVDGNSQGAVASYNFANVTAAHTISATFAIDQFTITVNAGANGSITPGTTTVNYGSNQSFSIAANTGYHIVDVLIDAENSQGAVTSYDFTNVIANHTISATFAIDQFTITVSAGANGSITPGTTTVNYGSNQSFSIAANVGYHIVDVLVDGNSQGTAASYNFSNVTALHTISASFAIDTFTVTSSLIGSNGTISPLGSTTVNYGSSQFYTITPDTGYQVDSVIVDGSLVDSTTSYTFDNITANHTIAVNFKLLPIVDTVLYRTFKASTSDLGTTKAVKLKFKNGALTSGEPNMMTVLENTFARIGKTGTTFLGVPQTDKDSSKKYAWIFAKKAGDFAKYYSITHTGLGYPIDSFRQTGKKAKKLSKALKPDKKYNNQMWAEAMMLRLNILASQDSITPKGFGALVLDTAATLLGRNLEGQTLSSIASYLDSLMTYWERLGVNDTSLNITELSLFATDVIGRINNGFSTVMNASNYIIDTNGVTKGDSTLVGKKKNSYAVTLLGYVPAESVDIVRRVPGKTVEPFIPVVGFREVPGEYVLEQNFPNPFNPTTSIVFSLPEETEVTLKVYSILGQEIATLISNKYLDAGEHEITFDASNLSSGVYFYRMNFGDGTYSTMKKMLLLK